MSSSSASTVSLRMSPLIRRRWRTASTMFPEPASPLVRMSAAPSPMRRRASPRSRQPQTNGTRNACLSTWFSSSAGVSTSLSSMKSTFISWRIWASTKCPMRTLAITGMLTVCWISRILSTADIRATPPCLRMSEGTRSSAMTATAPASSAILACSALVTSMMAPPFSISASPVLSFKLVSVMTFLPPLDMQRGLARKRSSPPVVVRFLSVTREDRSQPFDPFRDAPQRHSRNREPQVEIAVAAGEEVRAGSEEDAGPGALLEKRVRRERLGKSDPEGIASFWPGPRDVRGKEALEAPGQLPTLVSIDRGEPFQVPVVVTFAAELEHRRLEQETGVVVGDELGPAEHRDHPRRRDDEAQSQPGKETLGERADMEDRAALVERFQRREGVAVETELGVEIVFHHWSSVARGEIQEAPAGVEVHGDAGGVVERRHGEDELRPRALEDALEGIEIHANVGHRNWLHLCVVLREEG